MQLQARSLSSPISPDLHNSIVRSDPSSKAATSRAGFSRHWLIVRRTPPRLDRIALRPFNSKMSTVFSQENHAAAIFVIILAAAAGVVVCWAVARFFFGIENDSLPATPPEQAIHMREVRLRNMGWMSTRSERRDQAERSHGGGHAGVSGHSASSSMGV